MERGITLMQTKQTQPENIVYLDTRECATHRGALKSDVRGVCENEPPNGPPNKLCESRIVHEHLIVKHPNPRNKHTLYSSMVTQLRIHQCCPPVQYSSTSRQFFTILTAPYTLPRHHATTSRNHSVTGPNRAEDPVSCETAYLIWTLRCERIIREREHSDHEITAAWRKVINRRL